MVTAVESVTRTKKKASDIGGLGKRAINQRIESQTQSEQIYVNLKTAMMIGELQAGQSLAIGELAEHFSVSPMPVRQAITKLVAEGLLESEPKKAARVPDTSLARFRELARIRTSVEGLAVQMTSESIKPKAIARIRTINERLRKFAAAGNVGEYLELNNQFHFGIYKHCNSVILMSMIERLLALAGPSFRLLGHEGILDNGVDWHDEILKALKRRDGEAAARALAGDIQSSVDYFETVWTTD